jgi:hypothetical protein
VSSSSDSTASSFSSAYDDDFASELEPPLAPSTPPLPDLISCDRIAAREGGDGGGEGGWGAEAADEEWAGLLRGGGGGIGGDAGWSLGDNGLLADWGAMTCAT